MGKFIDFAAVEELASIEQLADMLGLKAKRSGRQLRSSCPVCGGDDRTLAITPDVKSKRGSIGVFFCQKAQNGGDRIGLVAHCMDMGQQDAAFFIAQQFGDGNSAVEGTGNSDSTISNSRATVPQKEKGRTSAPAFDPIAFAAKFTYSDEVAALGLSEAEAKAELTGFYRGHLYTPRRYPSGAVAGFWKHEDGKLVPPKTWLPDPAPNVVPIKRSA